ncbi:MAG: PSD1 and planctomycete cytochrome C domain-containing protein [Planctomycetota bacterium]
MIRCRATSIRFFLVSQFLLASSLGLWARADEKLSQVERLEFFEKEVRPLLSEHCFECHSTKAERLEANLLLDSREGHLRGGDYGPAIIPGDADGSSLIESVRYESYEMPPTGKLPDEDIEKLVRWVNMGAPWPEEESPKTEGMVEAFDLEKRKAEFWLWQPVTISEPPEVNDAAWPKTDIDRYILARLEEAGLKPSEDADKTAILRRLYFDLVGLPPTAEEVAEFISDEESNAIDKVVDRLLQSPHFGERWGRHWLDLVRYAESRGHEFDHDAQNAFQYRDYVIRALNEDVPYNQFVTEHIAGDLLDEPRLHPTEKFNESVLGTGFWFLGEWVHSPVDTRKDESDRFDNMIDVMSKTFLGVTVACARCHDHKFDAISTADYYSLSGFLQSSDYRQVRFEAIEQNRQVAAKLDDINRKYQQRVFRLLEAQGIQPPSEQSWIDDESIVVDYANIPQDDFMQDGFIFGRSPRVAGDMDWSSGLDALQFSSFGAAVTDPIWSDLKSVNEGTDHNGSKVAQLPKSGRTLRSPTFEVKDGRVSCLINGVGHIVACVDSHRLVAGPLHGQTVRKVKEGDRWVTLNLGRYVGHRIHLEFVPALDAQMTVRMVTQGLDANGLREMDRKLDLLEEPFRAFSVSANSAFGLVEESNHFEEVVFEDFESGTYNGWTVGGEAFGEIPQTLETIASYQGRINGIGKFFVNSHNIRRGGGVSKGDSLTGTLTSPEFRIEFDSIDFLIGGGAHRGETCVNLIIDGERVLSATGRSKNEMTLNSWDVRPFNGKTASIQVVDNHTSGWGNIGIDHIVFRKRIRSESIERSALAQEAKRILDDWGDEREQISKQIVRRSRLAMAMIDGTGEDDRVLIRGNSSTPGEVEPRHFLTAIAGNDPMEIGQGSGRLELARQINDPANPLTSRVMVNRIWHHLMGRGIVPTMDDFGVLGQRPTHPELLDHLASQFIDDGRSIKRMIKYIVTSRAYRMSSHVDSAAREADPKNLLWHHRPPRRLQGEVIRDSLLAVSGRLDRKTLGPSVPIHLTSFMNGRGRPKESGPLDGKGRRSIYISIRRNFLSPFMLTFDTPAPFSSMGRRNVSNVPAQALIMMNDPLVSELSGKWGRRAIENGSGSKDSTMEDRIRWMYLTGFGRQPSEDEIRVASAFVNSQATMQGITVNDIGPWASLAHALVNTKEFIFLR